MRWLVSREENTWTHRLNETGLTLEVVWSVDGGETVATNAEYTGSIPVYVLRSDGLVIDSQTGEARAPDATENRAEPFEIPEDAEHTWYLWIDGLEAMDSQGVPYGYYVLETIPAGWSAALYTRAVSGETVNAENPAPGGSTIRITNVQYAYAMPETGGPGTRMLYLCGFSLILLSSGIGLGLRRKGRRSGMYEMEKWERRDAGMRMDSRRTRIRGAPDTESITHD